MLYDNIVGVLRHRDLSGNEHVAFIIGTLSLAKGWFPVIFMQVFAKSQIAARARTCMMIVCREMITHLHLIPRNIFS